MEIELKPRTRQRLLIQKGVVPPEDYERAQALRSVSKWNSRQRAKEALRVVSSVT